MLRKLIVATCVVASLLNAGEIKVAVAANVSYAMPKLKAKFAKLRPDIVVHETLTSSGKLTAQIRNGAPYDLFMSANMKYPKALYKDGLAITKPLIYAQGSLAYLSANKKDFTSGIALIKGKDIQKIAIANPKTAPYGKASVEAMKNAKVYKDVKDKLVYAQTISQTVTYALTATDIGFVAKSTLYSDKMKKYKKGENWADVNPKLYTPINQGIVLLKGASKDAKAFYDFCLSNDAKEIFRSFGYLVP